MVSYLSICVAIVAASCSFALPLAYHDPLLGNGIGGTLVTGPIAAAGDLVGLGSGIVAVGNAGASGHIGRRVFLPIVGELLDDNNGIGGTIGTGSILAAGSIPSVAGGLVSVAGLGGSGHIGRSEGISLRSPSIFHDGIGGIAYTGPIVGAGTIPDLASGFVVVSDAGAAGHIGRSEDGLLHVFDNGIGGTAGTGDIDAAGVINHVAAGVVHIGGVGASGHLG